MKSLDEHDWDKIKRLRKKGLTFKELGDRFGINKATVWYRLAEMGKDKAESLLPHEEASSAQTL